MLYGLDFHQTIFFVILWPVFNHFESFHIGKKSTENVDFEADRTEFVDRVLCNSLLLILTLFQASWFEFTPFMILLFYECHWAITYDILSIKL